MDAILASVSQAVFLIVTAAFLIVFSVNGWGLKPDVGLS